MDEGELDFLWGHILDLAHRCESRDFLTSTAFLGFSERSAISSFLSSEGKDLPPHLFYGGYAEAERSCLVFLPSYLDEETFRLTEESCPSFISCLHIYPKSEKFALKVGHRDYLGSLLGLGLERERIGDILLGENDAYVYVLSENLAFIRENLVSVGRNPVRVEEVLPSSCPYRPKFLEKRIPVASIRLDSLLSGAFLISREEAKRQIEAGNVFLTESKPKPESYPKQGEHISLKGKGKFVYLGEVGTSRKGKSVVLIKLAS